MNREQKKDRDFLKISIFLFFLVIICFEFGYMFGINSDTCVQCTGIGGFVYQEIEWQEQTINIIEENCDYGMWVNTWEIESKQFLECGSSECKGEYCKDIIWKSPVLTDI